MSDYNHREQQFIDRINSSLQYLSFQIQDIVEYFEKKELERHQINANETDEWIEVNDLETVSLFKHLYEIKEFGNKSFFYNSVFANIYSFFEYTLINYCEYLNKRDKKNSRIMSKSKIYFGDCEKFLRKAYSIEFGSYEENKIIYLYKKARNIIMHNQSIMPDDNEFECIKKIQGIYVSENNIIYIKDTKILDEFIKTVNLSLIGIIEKTKHVC